MKIGVVCSYAPVELLRAMGVECVTLNGEEDSLEQADGLCHPNLCSFGRALLQQCLREEVEGLLLTNCCDAMRRVYDQLNAAGTLSFLYFMDLPHRADCCGVERLEKELCRLVRTCRSAFGTSFSPERFQKAFEAAPPARGPYVGLLGARAGESLLCAADKLPYPVRNDTCTGARRVSMSRGDGPLLRRYAHALLTQTPCLRMEDPSGRSALWLDPNLKGILYHTVKFCDYYGFEYAELAQAAPVPIIKVETDYTRQGASQLETRLEAFGERLMPGRGVGEMRDIHYVAGVDSGSASTDVVVLNSRGEILGSSVVPTGAGASQAAECALGRALNEAGLSRSELDRVAVTGYGRVSLEADLRVTEITCHARGAHFLAPGARTVLDIGGQDSKVIRLAPDGGVESFAMNDKCAAGTGQFLETMARTLGLPLEKLGETGLRWRREITISSMCTVFAQSEVVALVAGDTPLEDIVHGLNRAIASRTAALLGRVGGAAQPMVMTGGVSRNRGVVQALEAELGPILVPGQAQLCGALGAALIALE